MTSREPFDQLPRLTRLSSENIYRLMHLSGNVDAWHEESLTDVLRAHLAGAQYKVVGECPVHRSKKRCRDWDRTSVREIDGSIALSTKQEESKHGADMLMTLTNGDPDRARPDDEEVRFLLQAKRVRLARNWSERDSNLGPTSDQFEKLVQSAYEYGAYPYYLLYVQEEDPHRATPNQCKIHTSPQDCAAMLVTAEDLEDHFSNKDKDDPRALLERGTPLRCLLDVCGGRSDKASIFNRAKKFAESQGSEPPKRKHTNPTRNSGISSIVINPSSFTRTDDVDGDPSGDALVVLLGKASDVPEGVKDGVGEQRRGGGWHPDYSAIDLREAARQWWVVSAERARTVRYLVAVGDHEVRACYKITGARQVPNGRYEFEVEDLDAQSRTWKRLKAKTNQLIATRERGAQNPVTYVSI
jgi:ribosomal protein S15P/S13E